MIDLVTTSSPGAIASQLLARAGVRQPRLTFALKEAEHDRWTESFYGGWCEVDTRMTGLISSVASLDISSCFPLIAHLIGWWLLLCAERIRRVGVATALRRLCARAICRDDEKPTRINRCHSWEDFRCRQAKFPRNNEINKDVCHFTETDRFRSGPRAPK